MALIETRNLEKTFYLGTVEVPVLKGVDLAIDRGEFFAVMGPSGSGKSTLLYLLGGLDAPTGGTILIGGREIHTLKDRDASILRRRDVGFVFQFYNLIPNLTVEENILLPVLLDGKVLKQEQERLEDILETVGLSDRRKHTPRELSGGQQQRVAIARALINRPEIILADEPTGNLDTKTGGEVMELLRRVNETYRRTIVMVTHSREAAGFAERIIHVRDGRIWNDDEVEIENN
jgi:putative ABC transport system ATP-binding protein